MECDKNGRHKTRREAHDKVEDRWRPLDFDTSEHVKQVLRIVKNSLEGLSTL